MSDQSGKGIRALLIDAHELTVSEHFISHGLASIKALVGDVTITGHGLPDGHLIYVDDEGLYNTAVGFNYAPAGQPLMGNGLVVGPADREGNSTSCTLDIHELAANTHPALNLGMMVELPVPFDVAEPEHA